MGDRYSMLENRDYTLIIDKSGSMSTADISGTQQTRWQAVQESTLALAMRCEKLDPDGMTVYLFDTNFQRFDDVTSAKVANIFTANRPGGSTDLASVLRDAFNNYFQRKAAKKAKPNGELIIVVTDGEPNDQDAVIKVISDATHQMDRDEELAVTFIQIGRDPGAKVFLERLDNDLVKPQKTGFLQKLFGGGPRSAKFDICDTITFSDLEEIPITEVLLKAIED
jgi:uncharacterized protein with von Willebrand factor type A (vWA) domain